MVLVLKVDGRRVVMLTKWLVLSADAEKVGLYPCYFFDVRNFSRRHRQQQLQENAPRGLSMKQHVFTPMDTYAYVTALQASPPAARG